MYVYIHIDLNYLGLFLFFFLCENICVYAYVYIFYIVYIVYNTYVHRICKLHREKVWKYICQEIALLLSLYKVRESLTNKVERPPNMCVLLSFVAKE